jgi:hypothetical protein
LLAGEVADSSLLAWLAAITAARHRIGAAKAAAVRRKLRRSGLSWGIDRVQVMLAYHFKLIEHARRQEELTKSFIARQHS